MSATTFLKSEPVTAVIDLPNFGGESVSPPIVIGYYEHGGGEVWIDQGGHRVQIPAEHFAAVMRQLRRANKMALEAEQEQ